MNHSCMKARFCLIDVEVVNSLLIGGWKESVKFQNFPCTILEQIYSMLFGICGNLSRHIDESLSQYVPACRNVESGND